jgi:hypothetical protein
VADVDGEPIVAPGEHLEAQPAGPLLRDPPAPPGYVDPVQQNGLLEEPFGSEESE